MSVWRDMVIDGGLHIDAGCTIEEAAAWVEAQEYAAWEKHQEEKALDEAAWEEWQESQRDRADTETGET